MKLRHLETKKKGILNVGFYIFTGYINNNVWIPKFKFHQHSLSYNIYNIIWNLLFVIIYVIWNFQQLILLSIFDYFINTILINFLFHVIKDNILYDHIMRLNITLSMNFTVCTLYYILRSVWFVFRMFSQIIN